MKLVTSNSTWTLKKPPAKRYTAKDRERLEKLYGAKGDFFNTFLFRLNGGIVFH